MKTGWKHVARTLTLVSVTSSLPFALAACNTVKGAGQDIEETSDNTKKAFGGKPSSNAQPKTASDNNTTISKN